MIRKNIYLFYLCMCISTCVTKSEGEKLVHVKCGTGHHATEGKDLTGDAKRGNWPWMVKLLHNKIYLCGASLIDREFILTSASCVKFLNGNNSRVYAELGGHKFDDPPDQVITIKVKKILEHPFYSNETKKNDIAILQLVEPVDFNKNKTIRPICLAMHRLRDGENLYVIGWGTVRTSGDKKIAHVVLTQVKVEIVEHRDYCPYNKSLGYYPSGFCTSFTEPPSLCTGDSGSPVMYLEQRGSPWRQQGVASWSKDCRDNLIVNTDVSDYASWIAQVIFFLTERDMDQFAAPSF